MKRSKTIGAIAILTAVYIGLVVVYPTVNPSHHAHTRHTSPHTAMSQSHDIKEPSEVLQGGGDHSHNKPSHEDDNTESKSKPSLSDRDTGAQPKRPNIVFIMADDLGYNDVGYHNKDGVHTPTIDRLARKGVRLENYYVQPICSPSRIQFMSGRKLIHTGLVHKVLRHQQPYGLPLDSLTMADKLKEAGYNTDMIGKWHLGYYQEEYLPTRRGFNTFYGLYTGGGDHYTHTKSNMLDLHNDTVDQRKTDYGQDGVYSTHLFTDEAVRVIKHRSKGDKPFFLYLSYQAVHIPLQVPSKYVDRVKLKIKRENLGDERRTDFVGMTLAMDCGIKRVVKALKANGQWNNTVFIFSTDNGGRYRNGGSNLPLKGEKTTYYEGGVRAVGFVNSPLLQTTGYVNKEMIHISDWFKTFIALANGNLHGTRDVEGFNQWETISRGNPSPRNEILFKIDPLSKTDINDFLKHGFDTRVLSALRMGNYKLITGLQTPQGIVLYDIKNDPLEEHDLSMDEAFRGKVIAMLDTLLVHQNTSVPVNYPPEHVIKGTVIEPGIHNMKRLFLENE